MTLSAAKANHGAAKLEEYVAEMERHLLALVLSFDRRI